MGKIDVLDLKESIARYIYKGIKQYVKANEKAVFPTAPKYTHFETLTEESTLEERVKEWNKELTMLAKKFLSLSQDYNATQEQIDLAFDELKKIYNFLWI